jgi:uncharacterized Ntn-hydrolase superfamily protein
MTFTIVARCKRTGMLGMGTATNAFAVGVRVPHIRPRLGAVAIMAMADERLGPIGLRLLETGYRASGVIEQLVIADSWPEYRQLAVVDDDGNVAARTGQQNRDWAGHRLGDGYVVLGNALLGEHVIDAMEAVYLADPDEDLEERLMQAVEAGRDAGGQHGGQRSAALLVFDQKQFSRVDLRVDIHETPEAELRRVFDIYRPAIPYYDMRQVDPRVMSLNEWLDQQAARRN